MGREMAVKKAMDQRRHLIELVFQCEMSSIEQVLFRVR